MCTVWWKCGNNMPILLYKSILLILLFNCTVVEHKSAQKILSTVILCSFRLWAAVSEAGPECGRGISGVMCVSQKRESEGFTLLMIQISNHQSAGSQETWSLSLGSQGKRWKTLWMVLPIHHNSSFRFFIWLEISYGRIISQ